MPDYSWPNAENRSLIGKRISRLDSPDKVSGRAKYSYDYHPAGNPYCTEKSCVHHMQKPRS